MWSLIVSDYSTVTTILNGLPFNSNDYSERSEESASDETLRCAQRDHGGETFAVLSIKRNAYNLIRNSPVAVLYISPVVKPPVVAAASSA